MFNPKHLDSKVLLLLTLSRHDDHGFVPLTCDHLIQRSDRESGDTLVGQVPATSRQLVTLAYSDFFEMLGLYGFMVDIPTACLFMWHVIKCWLYGRYTMIYHLII